MKNITELEKVVLLVGTEPFERSTDRLKTINN